MTLPTDPHTDEGSRITFCEHCDRLVSAPHDPADCPGQ
jgi:hypothetical protein